jgi:hypothetical protein
MPAVRTRPRRRESPGEQVIDAHVRKPGHANREARADGWSLDRRAAHLQRLGERPSVPASQPKESNRRSHVRLLLFREVAHDAAPIQNLGSIPSS